MSQLGPFVVFVDPVTKQIVRYESATNYIGRSGGGGGTKIAGLGVLPTQIDVGDAAQSGVSALAARIDHQHALPAPAAPATVAGGLNAAGVATTVARADHQHRLELEVRDDGASIGARPALNFRGGAAVSDDAGNDVLIVDVAPRLSAAVVAGQAIPLGSADVAIGSQNFTTQFTQDVRVSFSASCRLFPDADGVVSADVSLIYRLRVDGVFVPGSQRLAQSTRVTAGEGDYVTLHAEGVVAGLAAGAHTAEIVVIQATATNPTALIVISPEGSLIVQR